MNLDKRLLLAARGAAVVLALTVGAGLVASVLAVAQAKVVSRVITAVFLEGADLAGLWVWMVALPGVVLARAAAGFGQEWFAAGSAARIKMSIREKLLEHLLCSGPVRAGERSGGDLVATAVEGVDALEAYFSQYLPQLALAVLMPVLILGVIFPIDALSGVILLLTGPLIPFFMFLIGKNSEKLTGRQFTALRRMSAFLLDTLQGLKTLKALGRSREQAGRIVEVSERYRRVTLEVLRITFLSALVLELLGTIGTAMIAVQVGLRLLYGGLAFETAFFLLIIAPDFYQPLRSLGLRFHASQNGLAAAVQIFKILEEPVEVQEAGWKAVPPAWQEIVFEQVSYRYPGRETQALERVSLRLRRGELTALVGESGAGKTTVAALLLRFITAQAGQIWIDGMPLEEISSPEWRKQIGWVPQQAHFMRASLADNLRIANDTASDDDLWAALKLASLDMCVRGLPGGLDYRLGVGAGNLSGGQAQRLALARAFLKDPALMVLDEPTASLDPQEESILEETTRSLCKGRMVLVIAHRLATVYQADQILVMRAGRVVEAGSHADLIQADGAYAKLVRTYTEGR